MEISCGGVFFKHTVKSYKLPLGYSFTALHRIFCLGLLCSTNAALHLM